jgi:uncharacterized protein YdhG (YjbR/CyaY superfamily)
MKPTTVDEYIDATPMEAQEKLRKMRTILKEVVHDAEEILKWGSSVFEDDRTLFAYKAFKLHYNFIPTDPALDPVCSKSRNLWLMRSVSLAIHIARNPLNHLYSRSATFGLASKIPFHKINVFTNSLCWIMLWYSSNSGDKIGYPFNYNDKLKKS